MMDIDEPVPAAVENRQLLCGFQPVKVFQTVVLVLGIFFAIWIAVPYLFKSNIPAIAGQRILSGYRLPNTTRPLRYDIELITHVHDHESQQQFEFEGKVDIRLHVAGENVTNITLHHREITVTHVKLSEVNLTGNVVIVDDNSSVSTDEEYEFLIVHPPSALKIGEYILEIRYNGTLREDNAGFYRSSYKDVSGETRWIAATQFEATDARHAFPCYDEPGIRAPIGLKLTHGRTYRAIANTPIKRQVDQNQNYTTTEFIDTPPMQTYLLAFVVSDFESVSDVQNNQSVYANPTSISNGDLNFALEAGVRVIHVLEDYLQMNYSLPKLDLVAIPDFAPGAMENWGLVTFREDALIYNSTRSPMDQLKRTVSAIGHEYAHQFFGDLVSPAWWSYLWLNEGFATLMQYMAAHKAYPELRIQELITVEIVQAAFQLDALEITHPMTSYVESPFAIMEMFDDITYDKSCSVLRQIQHALGDSIFRTGLKYYLDTRQFQAATPDNLAEALQKAVDEHDGIPSNVKVVDILNSWANQRGYPLLHVSRGADNVIKLRQERYLLKPSDDAVKATWYLPYNFATYQAPDFASTLPLGWLINETAELRPSPTLNWTIEDWVIFNKQQTGYYRVNYDANLWELIIHELLHGNHNSIHHLNRAQLIDDALNLARSGHLNYDVALSLAQYMIVEEEYVPWAALDYGLAYLDRMMTGSSKYALFKQYVWELIEPAFLKIGHDNKTDDSHFTKLTRNILINWACLVGSEDCLTQTNGSLAELILNKTDDIDPNLKNVVYCNGLRNANRETFMIVLDRMQRSQDPSDRLLLINALGCSQNSELLQLYLETSLNETGEASYRDQERWHVFSAVYNNGRIGLEVAMKFLNEKAETINRFYNAGVFGGRAIGAAVTAMGNRVVSAQQFGEFEAMNTKLVAAGYLSVGELARAEEEAWENVQWTNKNYAVIEAWLDQHVGSRAIQFKSVVTVTAVIVLSAILFYVYC